MTTDQLNLKIFLCESAIDLYLENGRFTISNLIDKTELSATEIYDLFPNKKAILDFYYPSLILRYSAMFEEIDDFDSYTISEKLSNFIFTMFDMMNERREFVEDTFDESVIKAGSKSEFFIQTKQLFHRFFTTDPNIAVSAGLLLKDYFYHFLTNEFYHITKYWLKDGSEGYERSMALTDKLTVFVEEAVYNKVLDKGFDLVKHLVAQEGLAKNIPIVGDWITSIFKDEDTVNE